MKSRHLTSLAITSILLNPAASCQQPEAPQDGAGAQPLPTDAVLGHGYVKRNEAIHFIGGGVTGTGAYATRIDMPSPQLLKKVVDSRFGSFKTAEGLDVASFEALSEQYTRDKDRVYFKVISPGEFIVMVLPDADPATFEVLETHIAKDRNHVWYYDRIQRGADPSSIVVIDGLVFKDRDSVHYGHEMIAGADPASFRHLGSGYYADHNRVYWCTSPMPDADPATFEVLGDSFVAKDATRAYRSGEVLMGVDVESLELVLHDPYGYQILADKNGIHLNGMTFPRSVFGDVTVIDNGMVKAGDLVFVVDTYHCVPVTVFKEDGKLMAETYGYDPATRDPQTVITVEVTPEALKPVGTRTLPGKTSVPSTTAWRIEVFGRPDLVQRLIEAGRQIR